MGAVRSGRVVSTALDPVLMPAGFQKGQYDEGGEDREGDAQIIYCVGHDEFSVRHPWLPQANQQEPGGACVDLVIEVRLMARSAVSTLKASLSRRPCAMWGWWRRATPYTRCLAARC